MKVISHILVYLHSMFTKYIRQIIRYLFLFCLSVAAFSCSTKTKIGELNLQIDSHYPRWMKSGSFHSDQTSGIAFINNKNGIKNFLLADDIGKIRILSIAKDTLFSFQQIVFSDSLKGYLKIFPKADFEEITFDKYTGNLYVSIEGDGKNFKNLVGIYKMNFNNNDIFSDTLLSIQKLKIKPESLFLKYVKNNIGYEGLAADKNYLYLGLEGFVEDGIYADSTVIFVVDKKSLKIIKEINTKNLGIHTACGLYSDKDYSLYGIDRNNKKIFHLDLDKDLNVMEAKLFKMTTTIPNYKYEYVAAPESITMDDEHNLYLTDDPFKQFFVPSDEILSKLDTNTVNNFKEYIPVIFKYHFKLKGE